MIIKKFLGKTEAEATAAAQKELGANVVVMNVKMVKRKGLFSFMKPQQVEVTVALEEEAERMTATKKEPKKEQETPVVVPERADTVALEEKLDSLQSLLVQQFQKPEKTGETDESTKEVKNETSVKQNEAEVEPQGELVKFMKLLYNTMLDNEVDEKNMPFDYALANTYQKMILKFGQQEGISAAAKGPKVVFFVGPTGVGKTTTIAKIASKFSVDNKKKVALLTADTYRIAAAEQLRTYANILEVPFRIIYTVEEIESALKDFADFDFIFVDTAGHSHQNKAQRDNMDTFIHSLDGKAEKEVFLVLSATTKYRDLLSIADTYSEMTDFKLIFTKLDETTAFGNLLNLKMYTGAPLSYVTYGQNVPDDIENFNPQKTVKQLLGGKK